MRAPPGITLVRGRAEPLDAGRETGDALLLAEEEVEVPLEGLAVVEGLLPEDGLPLDEGLAPEVGLADVEGVLADGVDGFDAGGGVACATGAPPPDECL